MIEVCSSRLVQLLNRVYGQSIVFEDMKKLIKFQVEKKKIKSWISAGKSSLETLLSQ